MKSRREQASGGSLHRIVDGLLYGPHVTERVAICVTQLRMLAAAASATPDKLNERVRSAVCGSWKPGAPLPPSMLAVLEAVQARDHAFFEGVADALRENRDQPFPRTSVAELARAEVAILKRKLRGREIGIRVVAAHLATRGVSIVEDRDDPRRPVGMRSITKKTLQNILRSEGLNARVGRPGKMRTD